MEDFTKIHLNFMGDKSKVLLTLFDGHSGIEVASHAIERFPEIFTKALEESKNNVEDAFKLAFQNLDNELSKHENTGSTACIIYICVEGDDKQRVSYSANCGDSRSVLVKKDKAIRLSYDHKAIDKEERKRVKKAGGLFYNDKLGGTLSITRGLGAYYLKKPEDGLICAPFLNRVIIEKDDRIIIVASHGVWDVINEDKTHLLVSENPTFSAKELTELFVKNAIELTSKNNISCIIVKLN
jgi:serine/threonine protein phosphatase PrpC